MDDLEFRHFDAAGARAIRDTVQLIHDDAYTTAIEQGAAFNDTAAFMERFDAYTSRSNGFELVTAYLGGEPVGQTWGWSLGPKPAWWSGFAPAEGQPPNLTDEGEGGRTFALSEIMVRQAWTGQGIAHAMHDELLRHRPERRATLLVDPNNPTDPYAAYLKWGWRTVGNLRPHWPDAPLFDVLILDLPLK